MHLPLAAALLAGCAVSGTQVQADCERQHAQIGQIVACTRDTLAEKNPGKLQDPKAKLYLLRGEQLAAEVGAGRLSNADARVAWQRLYIELWEVGNDAARARLLESVLQQQRQAAAAADRPAPVNTVCTSGPFLGQLRTECRSQ